MKKAKMDGLVALLGLLFLGCGLILVKKSADPQGIMKTLPYICIGLGCGAFGHGMGGILSRKAVNTDPAAAKALEIEQKDERNIAIADKAKAKAYDIMVFVFGALLVTFALMGVDMVAILLLVFAYLFVVGCGIYYRAKYAREM